MKRNNPLTNSPFKQGDIREDGYIFQTYSKTYIKKDGFYQERWYSPIAYKSHLNRQASWAKQNTEKCKASGLKYRKNNQHIKNANKVKYRCSKLQRTPPWLTADHLKQITEYYKQAKQLQKATGIVHHVDHIVPLQGDNVSGLHVPWNLQILTASENCSKSNKLFMD